MALVKWGKQSKSNMDFALLEGDQKQGGIAGEGGVNPGLGVCPQGVLCVKPVPRQTRTHSKVFFQLLQSCASSSGVLRYCKPVLNRVAFHCVLCIPSCRGLHPVLRRQHVHEGGDPQRHTHGGRGRVAPLHVPAGVRPPHGRHLPRVGRHAEAGAG